MQQQSKSNFGSAIAAALIDQANGRQAQHRPDRAGVSAELPAAFRVGQDLEVQSVRLAVLKEEFHKGSQVYFKTASGNIYLIARADDGRLACYNARNGSGHYLNTEDLGKTILPHQPANLAGYSTGLVSQIVLVTKSHLSSIRQEFLAKLGKKG